MGMDFNALLHHIHTREELNESIDRLEQAQLPEIQRLEDLFISRGFFRREGPYPKWERFSDGKGEFEAILRPHKPSLDHWIIGSLDDTLCLPADFLITFGVDAIEIYSLLRWHQFLENAEMQQAVLSACTALAEILGASEGVIAYDESEVMLKFRKGGTYCECLAAGAGGEVTRLEDFLITCEDVNSWDTHAYWRFFPPQIGE